jgi:hypothetical protein
VLSLEFFLTLGKFYVVFSETFKILYWNFQAFVPVVVRSEFSVNAGCQIWMWTNKKYIYVKWSKLLILNNFLLSAVIRLEIKSASVFLSCLFNDTIQHSDFITSLIERLMNVEQLVEWELVGEIQVVRGNSHQCHIVYHKSHMTWLGLNPSCNG